MPSTNERWSQVLQVDHHSWDFEFTIQRVSHRQAISSLVKQSGDCIPDARKHFEQASEEQNKSATINPISMDLSPLNSAHAHARKAALQTAKANAQGAREEHELAAEEFAKARDGIQDLEALRILELLEDHHRRLAALIKSHSSKTISSAKSSTKDGESTPSAPTATPPSTQDSPAPSLVTRTSTSPVRTRRPQREVSSSIANNLARQRRGLPATPELSTQQAGGRILSHIDRPGYTNRQLSPERTRSAPSDMDKQAAPNPKDEPSSQRASDDSFSKFYNTFEGLFSKLSGPLAFAGLPLTAEQAARDASQQQSKKTEKEKSKEKTRVSSSDEPDLTKIYSTAALKAIREDVGPSFGPQESFYLVPPTGGTVSYAGMVSGGRGSTHIPETIDEDVDEFVDARESLGPPSPRSLRSSGRRGGSPTASRDGGRKAAQRTTVGKTEEELELEITVLKQLLDTQAKRLQMWEMSSQSQSIALQQSMRAVRQRPDLPSTLSDPAMLERMSSDASSAENSERIQELEALIKAEKEEKQALQTTQSKMESENKKLQGTIGRYREQWERLKAGARKREIDKRDKAATASPGPEGDGEGEEPSSGNRCRLTDSHGVGG